MYYIFHGEDEFTLSEQVKDLYRKMGDAQFAQMNTTRLDGRSATMSEIAHAGDAIPFLLDKRLVIIEGMLSRFESRKKEEDERVDRDEASATGAAKELVAYLGRMPETTRLVFVESKLLAKNNPVLKHAQQDKTRAYIRAFTSPKGGELLKWIQQRVAAKKSKMEPTAVRALAAHTGSDLRLLNNEIEKLVTYRGGEPVRVEDVNQLVASVQESSVFDLVDALGKRETKTALDLLHHQLEHGSEVLPLFGMIVRQFRLLLQVKDLASRGMTLTAVRSHLNLHPFVANKLWEQARNFTIARLEEIYKRLLETDAAIKTGKSEPTTALDVLIVELTA